MVEDDVAMLLAGLEGRRKEGGKEGRREGGRLKTEPQRERKN